MELGCDRERTQGASAHVCERLLRSTPGDQMRMHARWDVSQPLGVPGLAAFVTSRPPGALALHKGSVNIGF